MNGEIGKGVGVGGTRQGLGYQGKAPTRCVCPKCGYEEEKRRGVPCRNKTCPKCNTKMEGTQ